MTHSRRIFGMLVVYVIGFALWVPRVVMGQTEDKAAPNETDKAIEKLDRARLTYETSTNRLRDDIEKELQAALSNAASAKDAYEATKKAKKALADFHERGELPEIKSKTEAWRKTHEGNQERLKQAYAPAMAAYTNVDRSVADALEAEADQLIKSWDLVPWNDNLVGNKGNKVDEGGDPISFNLGFVGEYRLEIKAKRTSGKGTMWIEFPTAVGKISRVDAIDKDKEIHVFLTVREALISADLGMHRPIDKDKAQDKSAAEISLGSKDGAFEVEYVRVKPVFDPPAQRKPDAKPIAEQKVEDKKREAENKQALREKNLLEALPVGTKLQGDRFQAKNGKSTGVLALKLSGEVKGNDGRKLLLRMADLFDGGNKPVWYDYVFNLDANGNLVLESMADDNKSNHRFEYKGQGSFGQGRLSFSLYFLYTPGRNVADNFIDLKASK